ncbi:MULTISPECIES: hypothetical protein [unclassified Mesorhizobium]|uniref:hypothetical protein n=1 Tax=unclassified Mesorhizobium TaxID=325217 RepID=UPI0033354D4E
MQEGNENSSLDAAANDHQACCGHAREMDELASKPFRPIILFYLSSLADRALAPSGNCFAQRQRERRNKPSHAVSLHSVLLINSQKPCQRAQRALNACYTLKKPLVPKIASCIGRDMFSAAVRFVSTRITRFAAPEKRGHEWLTRHPGWGTSRWTS